jgi:hypothetical protein
MEYKTCSMIYLKYFKEKCLDIHLKTPPNGCLRLMLLYVSVQKKCFQNLREKSEAHPPETVLCRQAGSSISNFNNYAKRFADVFKCGKRCKLNLSKNCSEQKVKNRCCLKMPPARKVQS